MSRVVAASLPREPRIAEHFARYPIVNKCQAADGLERMVKTWQCGVADHRMQEARAMNDDVRVVRRFHEPAFAIDEHAIGCRSRVLMPKYLENFAYDAQA